jgi:hypothetical protein
VLPGIRALDARLANPAYVLPVTGILMVLDADLGFTTFWIITAIILYVAMALIAGILFGPSLRRQVEITTSGVEPSVYAEAARRTTVIRSHHHGADRCDPLPDGHQAHAITREEGKSPETL